MKKKSTKKPIWVIKAGSQLVTGGGPLLLREWMKQVAFLKQKAGIQVVWVTSGAIATAMQRISLQKSKRSLSEKQALSAIGQPQVMDLYNIALQAHGLLGAQVLLTYDDLADDLRRKNFKNTVLQLLKWGVTPILNENDAVSTEEIQFGDNDNLSAKVAQVLGAESLVILTDVDGLFNADPTKDRSANLISYVDHIDDGILKLASSASSSGKGRGGMRSKLLAAKGATEQGIDVFLVRGDGVQILNRLHSGERPGTFFPKQRRPRRKK